MSYSVVLMTSSIVVSDFVVKTYYLTIEKPSKPKN